MWRAWRWFESDVVPDSGKTCIISLIVSPGFESDVVPDSGKTAKAVFPSGSGFESDVVPDSGKTLHCLLVRLY